MKNVFMFKKYLLAALMASSFFGQLSLSDDRYIPSEKFWEILQEEGRKITLISELKLSDYEGVSRGGWLHVINTEKNGVWEPFLVTAGQLKVVRVKAMDETLVEFYPANCSEESMSYIECGGLIMPKNILLGEYKADYEVRDIIARRGEDQGEFNIRFRTDNEHHEFYYGEERLGKANDQCGTSGGHNFTMDLGDGLEFYFYTKVVSHGGHRHYSSRVVSCYASYGVISKGKSLKNIKGFQQSFNVGKSTTAPSHFPHLLDIFVSRSFKIPAAAAEKLLSSIKDLEYPVENYLGLDCKNRNECSLSAPKQPYSKPYSQLVIHDFLKNGY